MFLFMDYYLKLITVHFLNYYLNLITVPVFGLLLELNQFLYLWFITCWWKDPYSVMGSSPVAYPPNREKSVLYTYLTNYFITVAVSQDFLNYLFHESNPYGPLINRLKWFYFKFIFTEIFAKYVTPLRLTLHGPPRMLTLRRVNN